MIAKVEVIEHAREKQLANKEDGNHRNNIQCRQRQHAPAGENRKQRLRKLIQASRLSTRWEIDATL
jgi:hypothetical protein